MEETEKAEITVSQTEERRKQRTNGEERFDGVAKRRTRTNRIGNHEHLESGCVRGFRSDPSASAGLLRRPAVEPPPFLLRSSVPPCVKNRSLRSSPLSLHRNENRISRAEPICDRSHPRFRSRKRANVSTRTFGRSSGPSACGSRTPRAAWRRAMSRRRSTCRLLRDRRWTGTP